jgi:hypothetical protein
MSRDSCKCNLITSFYIPTNDPIREEELKTALNNNLDNLFITRIHLFLDKELDKEYIESLPTEKRERINIIRIGSQPLYSELFRYANENLKTEVCMITNGDISLTTDINEMLLFLLKKKYIFALSRYEQDGSAPLITDYHKSHDMFIFQSPLNPNIEKLIEHKQNIWGSENRVIDVLITYNYKLLNPCFQIKILHHHDMKRANRIEANRPSLPLLLNTNVYPCKVEYSERSNRIVFLTYINKQFTIFDTNKSKLSNIFNIIHMKRLSNGRR